MRKSFYLPLILMGAFALAGCTTHPSPQQTMVDDRYMVYKEMEKAYRTAEEEYMNLLFSQLSDGSRVAGHLSPGDDLTAFGDDLFFNL